MTWREWLDSSYYPKDLFGEYYLYPNDDMDYIMGWNDNIRIDYDELDPVEEMPIPVKPDDVIRPGGQYIVSFSCFMPGTKVLTPQGLINIEEVKVGDEVYTRNNETNEIELKKVLRTLEHKYSGNIIKISTSNADVETTINHPFYVKDKGWTRADELKEGDILINNNNEEQAIKKIETIQNNETIKVYNLLVEDNHDYFVGLDCVLVHNKCIKAGSQVLIDKQGTTKAIEELKVGDTVLTYNEETGRNELTKVTGTFIHKQATDIVTIKLKDGTELVQNMYHPIYTKKGWKSLARYEGYEILENTDEIKTEKGWQEIESINIDLTHEPMDLYTISVEGQDSFYANGMLLHDNDY